MSQHQVIAPVLDTDMLWTQTLSQLNHLDIALTFGAEDEHSVPRTRLNPIDVVTLATHQGVIAPPPNQDIVAGTTVEQIIAITTLQLVVTLTTQ